jgi:hypothetical protein
MASEVRRLNSTLCQNRCFAAHYKDRIIGAILMKAMTLCSTLMLKTS